MRARRTDSNHAKIVAHARALGFFVWETFQLPKCCDCVLIRGGKVYFVEIKDGEKPPSQRKLTPDEIIFKNNILKNGGVYEIVENEQRLNEIFKNTL